jgi:hypothetical protein
MTGRRPGGHGLNVFGNGAEGRPAAHSATGHAVLFIEGVAVDAGHPLFLMRVRSVLRAPATSTMLKDPPAKIKPWVLPAASVASSRSSD